MSTTVRRIKKKDEQPPQLPDEHTAPAYVYNTFVKKWIYIGVGVVVLYIAIYLIFNVMHWMAKSDIKIKNPFITPCDRYPDADTYCMPQRSIRGTRTYRQYEYDIGEYLKEKGWKHTGDRGGCVFRSYSVTDTMYCDGYHVQSGMVAVESLSRMRFPVVLNEFLDSKAGPDNDYESIARSIAPMYNPTNTNQRTLFLSDVDCNAKQVYLLTNFNGINVTVETYVNDNVKMLTSTYTPVGVRDKCSGYSGMFQREDRNVLIVRAVPNHAKINGRRIVIQVFMLMFGGDDSRVMMFDAPVVMTECADTTTDVAWGYKGSYDKYCTSTPLRDHSALDADVLRSGIIKVLSLTSTLITESLKKEKRGKMDIISAFFVPTDDGQVRL